MPGRKQPRSLDIAQLRDELRDVLERTNDAFLRLGPGLEIIALNHAAALLLQAPKEELVGRRLTEVSPAVQGSDLERTVREALATQKQRSVEHVHSRSGRWYNMRCYPAPDEVTLFGADITERKLAEQALRRAHAELECRVAERTGELRALYDRLQTVREEERKALAREVHDQLGQLLSAAKIDIRLLEEDLRGASAPLPHDRIAGELRSARESIEKAIVSVQRIATELRPPELQDHGLFAAIVWHARDFERRTRIRCTVEISRDIGEPDGKAAIALFGIFQEAMTNILRHAKATCARISLSRRAGRVRLRICDDGIGIPSERARSPHSIGLKGMRERAAIAGGRLLVGPLRPRGTLVSAHVPLKGRP